MVLLLVISVHVLVAIFNAAVPTIRCIRFIGVNITACRQEIPLCERPSFPLISKNVLLFFVHISLHIDNAMYIFLLFFMFYLFWNLNCIYTSADFALVKYIPGYLSSG